MHSTRVLQAVAGALLVFGLLSIAASREPALPFFLAGETAFWVGVVTSSVGFVLFADFRRRALGGSQRSTR